MEFNLEGITTPDIRIITKRTDRNLQVAVQLFLPKLVVKSSNNNKILLVKEENKKVCILTETVDDGVSLLLTPCTSSSDSISVPKLPTTFADSLHNAAP